MENNGFMKPFTINYFSIHSYGGKMLWTANTLIYKQTCFYFFPFLRKGFNLDTLPHNQDVQNTRDCRHLTCQHL